MLYLIYTSGIVWLIPISFMASAVWRVVTRNGDLLDFMAVPLVFIALNQTLYCLRWALFHTQVPDMGNYEIAMWSGCYTLSIISALLSTLVWRIVRRTV